MPRASAWRSGLAAAAILATISIASPASACTIGTVATNFGSYNPMSASELLGYGTINVSCPAGVASTAILSISTGGSGSFAPRRMTSGGVILQYNLYTSAAMGAPVWGDGSAGTATVSITGAGTTTSTTVYGRIPGSQNVRPGTYTDTTIVTVTF